MSLVDSEKNYYRTLRSQYDNLVNLYNNILKSSEQLSLENKDITKAVLFRMKAYYNTQNNIKNFLNKRYSPAASDFFVETIIFYIKLIFEKYNLNYEVHSERQIRQKRGSIRPDISIWKNNKVLYIIECKTQLGYNRHKWEEDFIERETKLRKEFPDAMAFLLIMTSKNWSGFSSDDKRVGKKYFTLSSKWPLSISEENIDETIVNPIEDLFKQIM